MVKATYDYSLPLHSPKVMKIFKGNFLKLNSYKLLKTGYN